MKVLWCWRCKCEMPMLDDQEFQRCWDLMQECLRADDTPETWLAFIRKHDLTGRSPKEIQFAPVLDEYQRITGYRETNINAVWHHRISQYGPACKKCGKVLRTPVASKCFECGLPAGESLGN